MMRIKPGIEIGLLIALAACFVWALRLDVQPVWGQSPVSPLFPSGKPTLTPIFVPSFQLESQTSPLSSPLAATTRDWLTASFWASPWVWFAIGLVLFGGAGLGLVHLFSQADRTRYEP